MIEQLTLPKFPTEVNSASIEEIAQISLDRGLIEEVPDLAALLPAE